MKKILILGAGIYQVPLIKKAQEMGFYTIVTSIPGNYPGFAVADEAWEINTTDYEALYQKAKDYDLAGVCTGGTDVSVISAGYLCKMLDLNGVPFEAAKLATDKALMKKAFLEHQVSTPYAIPVTSLSEAYDAFRTFNGPAMVKAVDSSGSRGIHKISDESELEMAYELARKVTRKSYVLIERFIEGHEIGIDGLVIDNEPVLILPHDKFVCDNNKGGIVPEGHGFPYFCDSSTNTRIMTEITKAIHALGLNNCAFNADVLVSENEVNILEIGARSGGTCIPELISLHIGVDYYELMIRIALGEKPVIPDSSLRVPCMAKLLYSRSSGILTKIDTEEISKIGFPLISASLDHPENTRISALSNGTDRFGQVIVQTDSMSTLDDILDRIRKCIKIDDQTLDKLWN